jgi:hypothetical protein
LLIVLVLPGGIPPGWPALLGATVGIVVALFILGAFGYPLRRQPWTVYDTDSATGRAPRVKTQRLR